MQNIVHEVEKSEKFYSGDPPQIKNPERSAKGHANPSCTTLEFWSKTHLDSHRSSAQTQLGNFAASYRTAVKWDYLSKGEYCGMVYSCVHLLNLVPEVMPEVPAGTSKYKFRKAGAADDRDVGCF